MYRPAHRAVLARRRFLAALPARLQHERRRLGRAHRARGRRRRDRRSHAALSRSRLGQIQSRWANEYDETFARRGHGRRRATNSAEDHDRLRDSIRAFTNHVVPHPASRRGRNETNCHADDRRHYYLGDSRAAALPRHLRGLA